jgi:hypothetical protein
MASQHSAPTCEQPTAPVTVSASTSSRSPETAYRRSPASRIASCHPSGCRDLSQSWGKTLDQSRLTPAAAHVDDYQDMGERRRLLWLTAGTCLEERWSNDQLRGPSRAVMT